VTPRATARGPSAHGRRVLAGAWLTALALACAGLSSAAPRTDLLPRRVASLNLAADEILVEILPLDRLVSVTAAADDPKMSNIVGRIPGSIPRFRSANMERLIALQPDLVVVSEYTDADFLRLLESSGLRAHRMTGLSSLPGIRQAILDLGRTVGEPKAAEGLIRRFDTRLSEIRRRLDGTPRPRVLYWSNPFTAGGATAIGALIECGGGANVGRELGLTGIQPLGAERAFASAPDVILLGLKEDEPALRAHPLLGTLPAVREGRIVRVPPHRLATLSQHAAAACWDVAAALHPDRVIGEAP
jgi:iron complex transport system substrate-binding protein